MENREASLRSTAVFAVIHFLVDLVCIFLLTAFIVPMVRDRKVWMLCVLLYNFCAFALQLPVGALGDRWQKPRLLSAVGCILIAGALLLIQAGHAVLPGEWMLFGWPLLVSAVAGIGNSCFHVGGGIEVLKNSGGRAALPGVYVSTGAFGVWLGPVLAAKQAARTFGILIGILLMTASGAVLLVRHKAEVRGAGLPEKSDAGTPEITGGWADMLGAAALCLIVTVLLRSYAVTIMGFGWKKAFLGFLFTAGVVFGKMAGGFLGDRIGWMRAALLSLGGSAVLFGLAAERPAFGIAAVFLFNMTMPLTLSALARLYGGAVGTAFGMLTLALFLGTLPSMMTSAGWIPGGSFRMLPAVSLLSAALMAAGLSMASRKRGEAS